MAPAIHWLLNTIEPPRDSVLTLVNSHGGHLCRLEISTPYLETQSKQLFGSHNLIWDTYRTTLLQTPLERFNQNTGPRRVVGSLSLLKGLRDPAGAIAPSLELVQMILMD